MSKSHLLHLCIVVFITICLLPLAATAQAPVPNLDSTSRKGTTLRITTSTNNETFVKETKTEYFDKNGILRREIIQTKDLDGNSVKIVKNYDQAGMIKSRYETWRDKDGNIIYYEDLMYDETGKIIFGKKQEKKNDGKVFEFRYDVKKEKYDDGVIISSLTATTQDPEGEEKSDCPEFSFSGSLGYSYLNGPYGDDRIGFPLGVHADVVYNLTSRITAGIEASYHRKKELDLTLTRSFIMMVGKYSPGHKKDCDQNFTANIRLLMGMGTDRTRFAADSYSNTSKETGPAFGAGGEAAMTITKKSQLAFLGDFITVKWGDKWNNHFRLSARLLIILGAKPIKNTSDEW